jgi:hypothetical protein
MGNSSSIRRLAAGRITSHDGVAVELHRDRVESQVFLLVIWPPRPTRLPPTPQAVAELGRNFVRTLATAQAELARLQHGGKA